MARIPTKIGKYPVEDKIAEGGMGAVFKGTHPTLEQAVVLKKLTLNNSEHLTERFRREAKIMIDFSHENIVRVYDHFKQGQSYYIVQEFVDGPSVDIILKKERYLDINTALYIFYYACRALQYAHNRQVIHRDIKPANIMVSRNGEIKLVDFGIAQADSEEDALTKDGMTLGTPSYMAPEQFEDSRNVTCQADIYSLGVMLYEMLTGKKPFPGKINPETILKIQKGKYVSPKKLQPEIPSFVQSIIKNCMHAQLKKRPASIAAIMKKLDRWYQSAPIEEIRQNIVSLLSDDPEATKISPSGMYKKTNRLKYIGSTALVVILLAAGFLGYSKGWHYRYLLNRQYGGFQILLEIGEPLKSSGEMHISSTLFLDDNKEIPDIDAKINYRIVEESDRLLQLETDPVYLEPGTYRIKTIIDDQVIWKNIYLDRMNPKGSFFSFGDISQININWVSYRPLPLKIETKAVDRVSGQDLPTAVVMILQNNSYVPLEEIQDELMTDNVYKIRVEAEGYHSNDYHLRIQPYQSSLQLDAQLVQKEGFLLVEGLQSNIKYKINGEERVVTGGFPGGSLELNGREVLTEPLALNPSEYVVSFDYKGKTYEEPVTIERDQTVVLKLTVNEEDHTLGISKE